MSKLICASAIDGAIEWVAKAESMIDKVISEKGKQQRLLFLRLLTFFRLYIHLQAERLRLLQICVRCYSMPRLCCHPVHLQITGFLISAILLMLELQHFCL